jgi:hypothetical protein
MVPNQGFFSSNAVELEMTIPSAYGRGQYRHVVTSVHHLLTLNPVAVLTPAAAEGTPVISRIANLVYGARAASRLGDTTSAKLFFDASTPLFDALPARPLWAIEQRAMALLAVEKFDEAARCLASYGQKKAGQASSPLTLALRALCLLHKNELWDGYDSIALAIIKLRKNAPFDSTTAEYCLDAIDLFAMHGNERLSCKLYGQIVATLPQITDTWSAPIIDNMRARIAVDVAALKGCRHVAKDNAHSEQIAKLDERDRSPTLLLRECIANIFPFEDFSFWKNSSETSRPIDAAQSAIDYLDRGVPAPERLRFLVRTSYLRNLFNALHYLKCGVIVAEHLTELTVSHLFQKTIRKNVRGSELETFAQHSTLDDDGDFEEPARSNRLLPLLSHLVTICRTRLAETRHALRRTPLVQPFDSLIQTYALSYFSTQLNVAFPRIAANITPAVAIRSPNLSGVAAVYAGRVLYVRELFDKAAATQFLLRRFLEDKTGTQRDNVLVQVALKDIAERAGCAEQTASRQLTRTTVESWESQRRFIHKIARDRNLSYRTQMNLFAELFAAADDSERPSVWQEIKVITQQWKGRGIAVPNLPQIANCIKAPLRGGIRTLYRCKIIDALPAYFELPQIFWDEMLTQFGSEPLAARRGNSVALILTSYDKYLERLRQTRQEEADWRANFSSSSWSVKSLTAREDFREAQLTSLRTQLFWPFSRHFPATEKLERAATTFLREGKIPKFEAMCWHMVKSAVCTRNWSGLIENCAKIFASTEAHHQEVSNTSRECAHILGKTLYRQVSALLLQVSKSSRGFIRAGRAIVEEHRALFEPFVPSTNFEQLCTIVRNSKHTPTRRLQKEVLNVIKNLLLGPVSALLEQGATQGRKDASRNYLLERCESLCEQIRTGEIPGTR